MLKTILDKKHLPWVSLGIALFLVITLWGFYNHRHPSTDDAYVNANVINVATQVSGVVETVAVSDHQKVRKGDLLFTIDPRTFQYAVDKAKANLELSTQQMKADEDAIKIAQAELDENQAQYKWANKNAWRILTLAKNGQISLADGDQAREQLEQAQAALVASQSQLLQAKQSLGTPGLNNARVLEGKSELHTAQLNLGYTRIYATADGYIDNFNLRKGSTVIAGTILFQLVDSDTWWVDANFKETQLKRIRPGQPAQIVLDTYPGVTFKGVVQSISPSSGSSFSLFPAENATGNWVKVTQRVPVKILITETKPEAPLRVGISSTVTIDTTKMQ